MKILIAGLVLVMSIHKISAMDELSDDYDVLSNDVPIVFPSEDGTGDIVYLSEDGTGDCHDNEDFEVYHANRNKTVSCSWIKGQKQAKIAKFWCGKEVEYLGMSTAIASVCPETCGNDCAPSVSPTAFPTERGTGCRDDQDFEFEQKKKNRIVTCEWIKGQNDIVVKYWCNRDDVPYLGALTAITAVCPETCGWDCVPSAAPTTAPTASPTVSPTGAPSASPSFSPTGAPSIAPTKAQSTSPTRTAAPTANATVSFRPTNQPSSAPSASCYDSDTLNTTLAVISDTLNTTVGGIRNTLNTTLADVNMTISCAWLHSINNASRDFLCEHDVNETSILNDIDNTTVVRSLKEICPIACEWDCVATMAPTITPSSSVAYRSTLPFGTIFILGIFHLFYF